MNVSLPDELKTYVDTQVSAQGFGTTSEYVRELIRRDRDRGLLRDRLLEGLDSGPAILADQDYFQRLRRRASEQGS